MQFLRSNFVDITKLQQFLMQKSFINEKSVGFLPFSSLKNPMQQLSQVGVGEFQSFWENSLSFLKNLLEFFQSLSFFSLSFFSNVQKKACFMIYQTIRH